MSGLSDGVHEGGRKPRTRLSFSFLFLSLSSSSSALSYCPFGMSQSLPFSVMSLCISSTRCSAAWVQLKHVMSIAHPSDFDIKFMVITCLHGLKLVYKLLSGVASAL